MFLRRKGQSFRVYGLLAFFFFFWLFLFDWSFSLFIYSIKLHGLHPGVSLLSFH